jgi:hypothetical protein
MNSQTASFSASPARVLNRSIVGALRNAAKTLLARVRQTTSASGSSRHLDEIAGMNAHMLRDIGAASSLGSRLPAARDQYPRL